MIVYKVSIQYHGTVLHTDLKTLLDDLECLDVGDHVKIDVIEITEEEYNRLPEHEGY